MSNRYLVGAVAIGAMPVGKVVTRPATRAGTAATATATATKSTATRSAPAAAVPTTSKPVAAPPPVTKPATSTPKPATKPKANPALKSKMSSAASHAASTASKLAKRHPGMSGALKKISSTMSTKASKIQGDGIIGSVIGWFAEDYVGDEDADGQAADAADIAAQAGDIAVQIYNTLDTLKSSGKTDLMHEGEALVNSANYIVVTINQMLTNMTGGGGM